MLGSDLNEFAQELAKAMDVSVELDPRDLVLPGILVVPGPMKFDRLDGDTVSADLELWLVAGDTNPTVALDELTQLLLATRKHCYPAPSAADPIAVTLVNQSPDPLPAFRCPIPLTIQFDQETS